MDPNFENEENQLLNPNLENEENQVENNQVENKRLIQVRVHEAKAAEEGGDMLYTSGISNGTAVAIMGTYPYPNPNPENPRYDRFLVQLGDMFEPVDLDKLERLVEAAREAGLERLEAHILAMEPASVPQPAGNLTEVTPETAQNEANEVRFNRVKQRQLNERVALFMVNSRVTWYKYPVCHLSQAYRWSHSMGVTGAREVACQSLDLNDMTQEQRVINPIEDGEEEEDTGLRCC